MQTQNLRTQIKLMLGARGCSVTQLAEDLEVSRRSLSGYFSGKKDLKAETLVRILDYLGIDLRKIAYKKILLELQGVSDDLELQSDLGILLHSLSPL
ncbi:MAG: helix-turn-helix transcriptional regulator, partial [Pseudomonadota bacterium]